MCVRLCGVGVGGWGWGRTDSSSAWTTHMRLMSRYSVLDAVRGIGSSISMSAQQRGAAAANRVQLLALPQNRPARAAVCYWYALKCF